MHSSTSRWNAGKQKEAVTGSVSAIIGCRAKPGPSARPEGGSPGRRKKYRNQLCRSATQELKAIFQAGKEHGDRERASSLGPDPAVPPLL